MDKVYGYIMSHWDECIKVNTKDEGTLVGLPFPYTVPAVGHFDEMYYWDTYFTNIGLALSDRWEQAKYNTENILYMIDKYGFMPNGNRTNYLNNTQPPFASLMVFDIYEHYKDIKWLKSAYSSLLIEYNFWMTKRNTRIGLNQYLPTLDITRQRDFAKGYVERIGFTPEGLSEKQLAMNFYIAGESGWDINPRWEFDYEKYVQVDLNSLLYAFERNMEYFSKELLNDDDNLWAKRAARRKELMDKYMLSDNGSYYDYNFEDGHLSTVFSVASYYPMFAGMIDERQAEKLFDNLGILEYEYGISACEKNDVPGTYQWNYPNGWACLQYIMMIALDKYGYKDSARTIAEKYVKATDKIFFETGNIWEKYNVVEGSINVANEYKMPAMMGWTAGVYLASIEYLKNKK